MIYKTLIESLTPSNTNPTKTRGELRWFRRVSSSCPTNVTIQVITFQMVTDRRGKRGAELEFLDTGATE
jgi:hypothetical protein